MIPDDVEQQILRLHLVERWPVGTIARHCGVHHSTVRRVLTGRGVGAARTRRPSMIDPYLPFIHETLRQWPKLPASRLFTMVAERGYPGAPDHFRRQIALIRPREPAEAYLKLRVLQGEEAQVDWGHFGTITVGAATRPLCAFVMVLSWSRMPFVRFYLNQRFESFLDGHEAAFAAFGGVPRRALYDNLKSVVLERRRDAIRFHPDFLSFAAHYRFEPRPVGVARGNEKGRVERTIRYLRTSFWPARTFDGLEDLNGQVTTWCATVASARKHRDDPTLTVGDAMREEQRRLLSLPEDRFPTHATVAVKVGKQPYARFDANDYTVPHTRVRRMLTVHATPRRVRLLDGAELIADHERSYDRGAQVEDPAHLEGLVAHKRKAREERGLDRLHHAVPAAEELLRGAAERGHNLGSAVAGLLRLVDTWGARDVDAAVREAIAAGALHVAAVRQVLERRAQLAGEPPPVAVALPDDARIRDIQVVPHDLKSYDLEDGNE